MRRLHDLALRTVVRPLTAMWIGAIRGRDREEGTEIVEYALLALLVVVVVLVAAEAFFHAISNVIDRAREGLGDAGGSGT
jgi:hypothetical protein